METKNYLQIQNLEYSYANNLVFKNLSLDINQAKRLLLLGANGSGKSTFLKLLAEILKPQKGRIILPEKNTISYLSHKAQLYLNLSVQENLKIFKNLTLTDALVSEVLDFWGLKQIAKKQVIHISKGERQRLALAVCLINKPNLIFLDEPSANLDDASFLIFLKYLQILEDYHNQNVVTIIASHDLNRFCNWADSTLTISRTEKKINLSMLDVSDKLSFVKNKYLEIIQ